MGSARATRRSARAAGGPLLRRAQGTPPRPASTRLSRSKSPSAPAKPGRGSTARGSRGGARRRAGPAWGGLVRGPAGGLWGCGPGTGRGSADLRGVRVWYGARVGGTGNAARAAGGPPALRPTRAVSAGPWGVSHVPGGQRPKVLRGGDIWDVKHVTGRPSGARCKKPAPLQQQFRDIAGRVLNADVRCRYGQAPRPTSCDPSELPGCFASGRTLTELREALGEAIGLYLWDRPAQLAERALRIGTDEVCVVDPPGIGASK